MVSLWGSKKNGHEDDSAMSGDARESQETGRDGHGSTRDPDERTRLLPARPPPPNQDGYLDPDDPAVSPYNLWSVRFMRYFTVFFLVITFLWWVLLLVSIFVSPPGFQSRGSGFFDFSYATLTAGNLLVATLFFSSPASAERYSGLVLALFLLVDMIIILAVPRLRLEEGWVGIASVVWSTLMAMWCAATDRVVAWGKKEEEERLTGRPETRRTLREWLSVLVATLLLVVYIIIAILLTATLILRARDASLEMDGGRYYVDGGKYEVHLACIGEKEKQKTPTILLESGEDPSEYDFEHWAYAAYQNGTIDRYCYWDRPGYAWSDDAPSPHSAGMSADALTEALARAGEEGPWILVSAGYGSVVSRIFGARHIKEIVGIMMIDGLHEDLLYRMGSPMQGFILWGYGVISPLGLQRLFGALFKGRTREDRIYGRSAYQGGKLIKAKLQENLVADSLSKSEVKSAAVIQTTETPLVVITSDIEFRRDKQWAEKQEALTKWTDNLVDWQVVSKAPHEVWHTLEGRTQMEKSLKKLVKASKLVNLTMTIQDEE